MTSEAEPGRVPLLPLGALGMVTIVGYGVAYYSYGVLIDPIHADTHWSPASLGAIFSAVLVLGGIGGLAGGRLVDRVGTRPAFLLAGTLGAGAIAASSYQPDVLAFALFYATGCGVIAALSFYHVTQPAAIRAATSAPERAVVWLTILGAFASPIFLPLTAMVIRAAGWRDTIRVQSIIAAATFLIAAGAGPRERSGRRNLGPGSGVGDALAGAWHAAGFRRWVLASMISGAGVDVLLVYQVPVMIAAGLPITTAATIGGLRGLTQLAGRVPLTPVLARLGARRTIILSFVVAAGASVLLTVSGQIPAAIAYTVFAGASLGAIYTLQGIYTNVLVGAENLSLLMGAQQAVFGLGGAAGPLLPGILFEVENSYTPVLLLTAAAFLLSATILA